MEKGRLSNHCRRLWTTVKQKLGRLHSGHRAIVPDESRSDVIAKASADQTISELPGGLIGDGGHYRPAELDGRSPVVELDGRSPAVELDGYNQEKWMDDACAAEGSGFAEEVGQPDGPCIRESTADVPLAMKLATKQSALEELEAESQDLEELLNQGRLQVMVVVKAVSTWAGLGYLWL
jgi:hypothetical protein